MGYRPFFTEWPAADESPPALSRTFRIHYRYGAPHLVEPARFKKPLRALENQMIPPLAELRLRLRQKSFTHVLINLFSNLHTSLETPQLYSDFDMATPAQILANRQNAERSHGPVTADGKTRVSQNATKFGLFSVANFVRPEEQNNFDEFQTGYLAELAPDSSLEQTLAREIIHAAWRLRRCANLEIAPPADLTDEELDRLQISIDRARSAAQRTFHRSLKELRRLQAERVYVTFVAGADHTKQTADPAQSAQADRAPSCAIPQTNSAKQTQCQLAQTPAVPRSAPCPCKSGQKYKRCCGKNAPPVLTMRRAA